MITLFFIGCLGCSEDNKEDTAETPVPAVEDSAEESLPEDTAPEEQEVPEDTSAPQDTSESTDS